MTTAAPQANSLHLEWQQSDGADAVESYKINYCFSVNECKDEHNSSNYCFTIHRTDGSLRSYDITDTTDHPVEEDSTYNNISVIAVNSVTSSQKAELSKSNIVTGRACMCACYYSSIIINTNNNSQSSY